jgi:hypothetical protein
VLAQGVKRKMAPNQLRYFPEAFQKYVLLLRSESKYEFSEKIVVL